MGKGEKGLALFLILFVYLLLSSMHLKTEARPLNNSRSSRSHLLREIEGFFRAVKSSGPSPGNGHRFKSLHTLEANKKSGPSPGVGHDIVTGGNN
uniref:Uncharacterized protein n=1 Tax=Fagus sylvatica TaxID=28930 RepID=A0A2N9H2A5_FAGSY